MSPKRRWLTAHRDPRNENTASERRRQEYYVAIRVLLEGISGANAYGIARGAELSPTTVRNFLAGGAPSELTVESLERFVWDKLNAHLLLCDEDRQSAQPKDPAA